MGRNRVLSFIAQFSAPHRDSRTPTPASSPKSDSLHNSGTSKPPFHNKHHSSPASITTASPNPLRDLASDPPSASSAATTPSEGGHVASPTSGDNSPSSSPTRHSRRSSRPLSMVQTYHPPVMAVTEQTLPELQPIFTLLNSHSNKLYQEGYFLKLDDQDIRGKPNPDRTWTECFAQLVGTVLSLWDAAELDAAGEDGEVLPKFINLTDASIKMIESLPTKSNDEQPLQNILSISTAGRNRYLLHFNSHHSLIQWTSAIRLAMFEHSTLQEAYTGALVAGKGKALNNINIIMERARQPVQEWVRVRFGAGVPWRRCYCVIEPPSEKEYQKAQKEHKKRSPYDRSHGPVLKGEVRFFDTKKEAEKKKKHQRPIASITDAYSAYSIYPQAKELIDSSTLLKIEGNITIHTEPASSTEGFVFIMPETPPAVSGFEMLLRFLFPTWDTFALYGRPGRLVASSLDSRSLMFAMPKHKRYGYLELLDVSGLIVTDGSPAWSEREWRKRLKELTGQRMAAMDDTPPTQSRSTSRNSKRLSFGTPAPRPRVGFAEDGGSVRSSRSQSVSRPGMRNDSAPPDPNRERAPSAMAGHSRHSRHISDTQLGDMPSGFGSDSSSPTHALPPLRTGPERIKTFASDLASTPERVSSEDDSPVRGPIARNLEGMKRMQTPEPVNAPPAFAHSAGSRPQQKPYPSPEMRRATNRLSNQTLSQLAKAGGLTPEALTDEPRELHFGNEHGSPGPSHTDPRGLAVQPQTSANAVEMNANFDGSREVLTSPTAASSRDAAAPPPPLRDPARKRSNSPLRAPLEPVGDIFASSRPVPHGAPPPVAGRRTPPPGPSQPQQFSPVSGGSPPVHRKPLPVRTTSLSRDQNHAASPTSPRSPPGIFQSPGSALSFKSLNDFTAPPMPAQTPYRQRNAVIPDDASSTGSPDYASTRRSIDTQDSVDRPRAGVLKVIGDGSAGTSLTSSDKDYDIPEINFGRTLNYAAPALPDVKKDHQRAVPPSSGRKSPGPAAAFSHGRQQSDDTLRRSVAWPGPAGGSSTDNAASLQQALQPRTSPTPQYAHQRVASTSTLTDFTFSHSRSSSADLLSSGRPLGQSHSRHSSADLLASARPPSRGPAAALSGGETHKRSASRGMLHSRNSSADLLSAVRPSSQGTAAALSAGEVSSYLSAREQEHVARITGSPLVAFATSKGPSQTQAGLVGAIDARERERAQMRQGIGGQAVAQAIDQRYREQNQQAQRAAQAAYAQQQAQYAAQQAQIRPQTPGSMGMGVGMGMMMGGGGPAPAPSPYGPPPNLNHHHGGGRPQTPGAMSRMMDGGGAPSPYPAGFPGMNRSMSPGPGFTGMNRSMSPGPNMMGGGPGPGRFGPGPGPLPLPQRSQTMPHSPSFGGGPGGGGPPGPGPAGGWNMPPPGHRQGPGPMMPSPSMGMGFGGVRPQSPAFQMPPQGQFAPPGTPGGPRPGTPGRMQFQGQAF